MALAFVALLAALSGTAIALPGTNSVQSNDIKRNAVTSPKIKRNAVRSSDIKRGAVRSSDVKNDSLTGSDINESTLGKVPSAGTADKAGTAATAALSAETARLRRWSTATIAEGSEVLVFSAGGVTLTASCVNNGGATELQYVADGPATAFAEGEDADLDPGDLPGTINNDASSSGFDILNAEDGGWQIGNGSLRVVGVLGGIADGVAATCQAFGFGTID